MLAAAAQLLGCKAVGMAQGWACLTYHLWLWTRTCWRSHIWHHWCRTAASSFATSVAHTGEWKCIVPGRKTKWVGIFVPQKAWQKSKQWNSLIVHINSLHSFSVSPSSDPLNARWAVSCQNNSPQLLQINSSWEGMKSTWAAQASQSLISNLNAENRIEYHSIQQNGME